MDRPTRISSVTITLNEEHNIELCLESLKWVDEMIIVDSFSTDKTVEICRAYTDKIYQRPWPGFGAQKNFAIDQALSEWILIVDADERITEALRDEIKTVVSRQGTGNVGYHIPRRNFWYGKWIRWAGMYPDYQLRLFKKSAGRYNDVAVHENLILNGPMGYLKNPMDHFTERHLSDHFRKFSIYTSYAAQEKAKKKRKVFWTDLALNHLATFLKSYLIRQGYRDGIHGFIISVLAAMYTFAKYAKLWEMYNGRKI
jgi:glycosyltransferase involved in cell wall biosynthesis